MAWISKVNQQDYVARFMGAKLVVENRRTNQRYPLTSDTVGAIRQQHGFAVTSPIVIQHCIDNAIIPHPCEEYV